MSAIILADREKSGTLGLFAFGLFGSALVLSPPALAQSKPDCSDLPNAARLRSVLQSVVMEGTSKNGGLDNQEWAVIVNRDGIGCAVVFSGTDRSQPWPGSRVIAASKANTANGSSNSNYAIFTSNLYAASQPGGSLYNLATSGPPIPKVSSGDPASFGIPDEPMVGKLVGGTIVFGDDLALYNGDGKIVGGLGLSGNTSCTDHIEAWKVRHELALDAVPMGPSPAHNDNMILDRTNGHSLSGYGQPDCKAGLAAKSIVESLSKEFPTLPKQH